MANTVLWIMGLLYFILPAYFATMAPVFARNIQFLAYPIDAGRSWCRQRVFGDHKTWRGIFFGILVGLVVGVIQYVLSPFTASFSLIDYSLLLLSLILALLLSTGALVGDLIKSFFKRRIEIQSGKAWVPFDQIDYSIGAIVFGSVVYFPGFGASVLVVVVSAVLHIIVNIIGYYLKMREKPV